MDIHKVQKWLEFTNANQKNDFWQNIFDQQKPERLFEENHKPLYDLYKSDTHVCAVIELPGVGRDDVTFALKSNIDLIVKGHKRALYPRRWKLKNIGPTGISSGSSGFLNLLTPVKSASTLIMVLFMLPILFRERNPFSQ